MDSYDLKKYLSLTLLAILAFEYMSIKTKSFSGLCIFTTIAAVISIAIIFLDFWNHRKIKHIKITSFVCLVLSLLILILSYTFTFVFFLSNFSYFLAHEKILLFLFYAVIALFSLEIILRKIYIFQVNKFEKSNKKFIYYIILGVVELFIVFSFCRQEGYRIESSRITEIESPTTIAVTKYKKENQKIEYRLNDPNSGEDAFNSMLLNRATRITNKSKIDKIITAVSNKNCSLLDGYKRTKLYNMNLNSPSIEIDSQDSYNKDHNNIYFEGINILGDGNVIFKTYDCLDSDGKTLKKQTGLKEYLVELTDEEKHELISLVNDQINKK